MIIAPSYAGYNGKYLYASARRLRAVGVSLNNVVNCRRDVLLVDAIIGQLTSQSQMDNKMIYTLLAGV